MLMTPPNATLSFASSKSNLVPVAANQPASQDDIERRILEVRAGWDIQERIRRRRAAKERYGRLLETLLIDSAH